MKKIFLKVQANYQLQRMLKTNLKLVNTISFVRRHKILQENKMTLQIMGMNRQKIFMQMPNKSKCSVI